MSIEDFIKNTASDWEGIEKLLEQYGNATDQLLACETENTEEINSLIEERQRIIEQIEKLRVSGENNIAEIEKLDPACAAAIRKYLSGENVGSVPERLSLVHKAAVNLRSAQSAAVEKDNKLKIQFTSRYNEVKDKLGRLRDEKKKIDFYEAAKSAPKSLGGSFDSRS